MAIVELLKKIVEGEVSAETEILEKFSHDASLFEVKPQAVVFPKDSEDIKNLVKYASDNPPLSLTARAGGTDMTGGPLSESIILDFTKHFTKLSIDVKPGLPAVSSPLRAGRSAEPGLPAVALAEAGVWYRDFEKETLKTGWLLPSYPASKEICAIGGMIGNNAGGEKTLKYGKIENYIESLKIVLSDGNEYEFKKLTRSELDGKITQNGQAHQVIAGSGTIYQSSEVGLPKIDFEGEIYREVFKLLDENYELIKNARPKVSKNSAGYNIWNVWNKEKGEFDLAQLIVGSQGTLGLVTETKLRLVRVRPYSGILVAFINDFTRLPELINRLLPINPISMESFDNHTFKLALKFFWSFKKTLEAKNLFSLILKFLPDFWMIVTRGIPKLVLLTEFEGNTQQEVDNQIKAANEKLKDFEMKTIAANTKEKASKYLAIRRESFNLLRKHVKGKRATPFIDDVIVQPRYLPEFLPKLIEILNRYRIQYTLAGHVGDGNFHVIPLMKLNSEEEREKIFQSMDEVYKLVLSYGGSFTAEHNDGIIRTPYLKMMYGEKIYKIFEEIKKIFDPKNIFNPGKKVGGDLNYAKNHIKLSS